MIVLGVTFMGIGAILIITQVLTTNNNIEIAELKEAQYMQEYYGYQDNMNEYLEYLKVNDFSEYLRLKSVYEEIHSYEQDWLIIGHVGMILFLISIFVYLYGVMYRQ